MVRAVKRKHANVVTVSSLGEMTNKDIGLMNAEFAEVAAPNKLAERVVQPSTFKTAAQSPCGLALKSDCPSDGR